MLANSPLAATLQFMNSAGRHAPASTVWRDISAGLDADMADFYAELMRHPELSAKLGGPDNIPRLIKAQQQHWQALFADELSEDVASRAHAVGAAHKHISLSPSWYMAAYGWVLMRLIPKLTARHRFSKSALDKAIGSLISRVFTDMMLSNSAYQTGIADQQAVEQDRDRDILNLRNLAGTVTDVNEVSFDLAFLSRNTQNLTSSAQTISAAAAELVASVEEISRNSEGAANDAAETDQTVQAGRSAVQQVNAAITNIAAAVEETARSVDELSVASEHIGQILTVIEGIAQQTNLLALNATIEAARAGEAGKGFAVVASEVKGLATQTSKSTEDITRRIASLREGMGLILKTMERSKSAVVDGQGAIAEAASTMGQVAEQVGNVSAKMQGIADILHQQKGASSEIAGSIQRVADIADENQDLLASMAGQLHTSNTRFSENASGWFQADSNRALVEMAKIDHVLFKKRVVDVLMGRGKWSAPEVPDHHNCRLGKWYDSLELPEIRQLAAFSELVEPHTRVHSAAREALDAYARHDMNGALEALKVMNSSSIEVLHLLEQMAQSLHGELGHMDRRVNARYVAERKAEVEIDGKTRMATVRDISAGGMKVEGLSRADIGKPVRLSGGDSCCSGTTVWSDGKSGGIRFDRTAAAEHVQSFISNR